MEATGAGRGGGDAFPSMLTGLLTVAAVKVDGADDAAAPWWQKGGNRRGGGGGRSSSVRFPFECSCCAWSLI
jgi:hypothetical protein